MAIKCLIGLGNPGDAYVDTRHNIGFKFIRSFIRLSETDVIKKKQLKSRVYTITIQGQRVICVEPQTFMNLSGEAVQAVMQFYKIQPSEICVVYDDFDIPFGSVRARFKGSGGTHNGMKSILQHLFTNEFLRIRLGIGPLPEFMAPNDFVLKAFSKDEAEALPGMLETVSSTVADNLTATPDVFMNRCNRVAL
jgi:peptidyl-tRNA hydrolase, PTH1 family